MVACRGRSNEGARRSFGPLSLAIDVLHLFDIIIPISECSGCGAGKNIVLLNKRPLTDAQFVNPTKR
jgi:hypothetical protein